MPSLNHDVDSTELRGRLEMAIHYLILLDQPDHALGACFTLLGWSLTVQELIARQEHRNQTTSVQKSVP